MDARARDDLWCSDTSQRVDFERADRAGGPASVEMSVEASLLPAGFQGLFVSEAFPRRERISLEGGSRVWVVLRGCVKLVGPSVGEREKLFEVLGPGELFGAVRLDGQEDAEMTAVVEAGGRVAFLSANRLGLSLRENGALGAWAVAGLARRAALLEFRARMILGLDPPQRLAALLLALDVRFGLSGPRAGERLLFGFSRREIGN